MTEFSWGPFNITFAKRISDESQFTEFQKQTFDAWDGRNDEVCSLVDASRYKNKFLEIFRMFLEILKY